MSLRFLDADPVAKGEALDPLPTRVNYFHGSDPAQWRTQVPTFARVRYTSIYPGIDLVYYGKEGHVEFDLVVGPNADPSRIRMGFTGVERVEIDGHGDLVLHSPAGPVKQLAPVIHQESGGQRSSVSGRYKITGESDGGIPVVGIEVGDYDAALPLTIDPVLVYSQYLGGLRQDTGWDIAVDALGNAYVTGTTTSTNFPLRNAVQTNYVSDTRVPEALRDVFVAKIDATGTNLLFSTYLGGAADDAAFGITLDSDGNILLAGQTMSTNFPVTANAVSTNIHGAQFGGFNQYDAFVAKLDADGANLLYSTYLGGSQTDVGVGIASSANGNVFVTGFTSSPDFPTHGVASALRGSINAFVTALTATDDTLLYSRYLGGSGQDRGQAIQVDDQDRAVVAGFTSSIDFPVTNAVQATYGGGVYDAFVTRLSADGTQLIASTYLGGIGQDEAYNLALGPGEAAFVTGVTASLNFPLKNALYGTNQGLTDVFLTALEPGGTNLLYSTFFGGVREDEGWDVAVDDAGTAYVTGRTLSVNFPTNAVIQTASRAFSDAFVFAIAPGGTSVVYSVVFGGAANDSGYGLALDSGGNVFIAGETASLNLPVLPSTNGWQNAFGGGVSDAFIAKLYPGNPELDIRLVNDANIELSWSGFLSAFQLESLGQFGATNTWTLVDAAPQPVGTNLVLPVGNVSSNTFYRLRLGP